MKNRYQDLIGVAILSSLFLLSCKSDISEKIDSSQVYCSTPPLGWNSYDSYGVYLDQKSASVLLDIMAEKYLPYGYNYFVIDAGWYNEAELVAGTTYPLKRLGPSLDENGIYEPSKTYFPQGIKGLADKAHKLGLKFGLHLMRGIPRKAVKQNLPIKGTSFHAIDIADTLDICTWSSLTYGVNMSKPGAQEWYNSIFEKFSSWGVDFVKVDDMTPYPLEIEAVQRAIINCGREMTYSLSPGDVKSFQHLPYYRKANMVRITGDIWDRETDLDRVFASWKNFQGMATAGFWPDMDMIPFGNLSITIPAEFAEKPEPGKKNFSHWCRLTKDQMKTFITTRALAASPLFIGGDLLTMDDFSYSLLTNREMLECNQNGVMGINTLERDSVEIWNTNKADQFGEGWIGIFNRSVNEKEMTFSRIELGLFKFVKSYKIIPFASDIQAFDIWNERNIEIRDSMNVTIPGDGVVFIKYTSSKNR